MKNSIFILVAILSLSSMVPAQTLTHKRLTISSGGGLSSDGTFTNQVVMGQTSYGESDDSVFIGGGGFLGGSDDWMTSLDDEITLPLKFELSQNYPNPFNPATTIDYSLAEPSHVIIEIFNILGQRTEVLVNEKQEAGYHSFTWNAGKLPSGVYFYQLRTADFVDSRKMMLLK